MVSGKKEAVWVNCTGEAHKNFNIDNCWVCMPYWELYPACPVHLGQMVKPSGYCKKCKKFYSVKRKSV